MSSEPYKLWCLIEGDGVPFFVTAPLTKSIGHLKDLIKEKGINPNERAVLAKDLILWKVRMIMAQRQRN